MLTRKDFGAGASGITDQVLLSATNLIVGLTLARQLAPASFGVYVIAFAVMLAGSSAQLSLVTDPLLILGAPKKGAEQSRYLAALLWIQVMVSVAVAAATLIGGEGLRIAWGDSSAIPVALIAVAAATVPIQLQAFFRAILFARLRAAAALWNDAIFCALRLAMVALLIHFDRLSVYTVLLAGGAAASLAAVAGMVACRDVLGAPAERLSATWAAHWDYGRWLLATSGAFWLSGQAPAILASSLLTPVAAAVIKACQYLVAPLNVAIAGLDGVLAPRAAKTRAEGGERALRGFLRIVMMASGAAALLYGAVVLPLAPALLDYIYRGRYAGYTVIVAVLLLDAFLSAVNRPAILRLKVAGATRTIFIGYLWAAGAGLGTLLALAPRFGIRGAAVAAPAASAALLVFLILRGRPAHDAWAPAGGAGSPLAVPEP